MFSENLLLVVVVVVVLRSLMKESKLINEISRIILLKWKGMNISGCGQDIKARFQDMKPAESSTGARSGS